jgi:hypothetical protein
VEEATWLSPIVVVPKKNGKLCICVDFQKLNAATKKDLYPLPFMEEALDMVARHKVYSFLDRFFWLPSNHDNIGRLIQNNLHHQMGHFYVVSHQIMTTSKD